MFQRTLLAVALLLAPVPALAQNCRVSATTPNVDGNATTTTLWCDTSGNLRTTGGGGGGGGGAITPSAGSQETDVRTSGQSLNVATLNNALVYNINGQSELGLTIAGLAASGATISYEQSNDGGTTYTPMNEVNKGTGVFSATRNTDGQFSLNATSRTNIRLRVTTAGTGSITVASNLSVRAGLVSLNTPVAQGPGASTFPWYDYTARYVASPVPQTDGTIGYVLTDSLMRQRVIVDGNTLAPGAATSANQASEIAALGAPGDAANANTILGQLKQSNINLLTPIPLADGVNVTVTPLSGTGNLFTADTFGYGALSVQLTGTWVGTVAWSGSNDGTNWNALAGQNYASATTPGAASDTTNIGRSFSTSTYRYIRGAVTAYTSGTVAATVQLRATAAPPINPVNINVSSSALPSGAATSANQTSEIAALGAIGDTAYAGTGNSSLVAALKGVYSTLNTQVLGTYTDFNNTTITASTTSSGTIRTPGNAAGRYSVTVGCTQAATVVLKTSNDAFTARAVTSATAAVAVGSMDSGTAAGGTISIPATATSFRVDITMGGTTGSCTSYAMATRN